MSRGGPLAAAFQSLRDGSRTWGGPDMPPRVESWLEQRFAWQAIKYVRPEIELCPQVEIATAGGTFRVDFLTVGYRLNLVFECDGAAFHTDPEQDRRRDEWLLVSRAVWGIYRLPYRDLVEWPEWCFLEIARRHYELFTDAGLTNLRTLTRSGERPKHFGVSYRCRASA